MAASLVLLADFSDKLIILGTKPIFIHVSSFIKIRQVVSELSLPQENCDFF